jgi:hypothetical protein
VHWPSGIVDGYAGLAVDQAFVIVEGSALGPVDVAQDLPRIPEGLTLHGAAPNPFRAGTRITFTMAEEQHVTLRLFDLAGRIVSTVLDERRGAGRHEVQVAGPALPHGILFYSLEAGGVRRSGRVLHLE